MIPYEELVSALTRWRERQGLDVHSGDIFAAPGGSPAADLAALLGVELASEGAAPEAELAPDFQSTTPPDLQAELQADLQAELGADGPGDPGLAPELSGEGQPPAAPLGGDEDSTFVGASPAWQSPAGEGSVQGWDAPEAAPAAADYGAPPQPAEAFHQPVEDVGGAEFPAHATAAPTPSESAWDPGHASGDPWAEPAWPGAQHPEPPAADDGWDEATAAAEASGGLGGGPGFAAWDDEDDRTGIGPSPHVPAHAALEEEDAAGPEGAPTTNFPGGESFAGAAHGHDWNFGDEGVGGEPPLPLEDPGAPSGDLEDGGVSPAEASAQPAEAHAPFDVPGGETGVWGGPEYAQGEQPAPEPAGAFPAGAGDDGAPAQPAPAGAPVPSAGAGLPLSPEPGPAEAEGAVAVDDSEIAVDDGAIVEEDPLDPSAPIGGAPGDDPGAARTSSPGFVEAQTMVRPAPSAEEPGARGATEDDELDVDIGDVLEAHDEAPDDPFGDGGSSGP